MWLVSALWVAMLFSGCQGMEKKTEKPTFMEEWREKAETATGHSPGTADTAPLAAAEPEMIVPPESEDPVHGSAGTRA